MESTDYAEDFRTLEVKPNLRSRNKERNVVRHLKKHFEADATVIRTIIDGNPVNEDHAERLRNDPLELGPIHFNLRSPMNSVEFSLNKRKRWDLPKIFDLNIHDIQDVQNRVKVSALEVERRQADNFVAGQFSRGTNATAYHTVEDDEELHRYPRKSLARPDTLTEKAKPPKPRTHRYTQAQAGRHRNRGNDQRYNHQPEPEDQLEVQDDDKVEVRYIVTSNKVRPGSMRSVIMHKRGNAFTKRNKQLEHDLSDSELFVIEYENGFSDADCEERHYEERPAMTLADFTNVPSKKPGKKKNKMRKSIPSDSTNSSSDDWSWVQGPSSRSLQDPYEVPRPWIRQVSKDDSFIPYKYRTPRQQQRQVSVHRAPVLRMPSLEMSAVVCKVNNSELEPDYLKDVYGSYYYECSCVPRRFCVDISDSVRNVMEISRGEQSRSFLANVLLVFEVSLPTFASLKHLEEGDDHSNVRVWINGLFTDKIWKVNLNGAFSMDEPVPLGTVLQSAAVRVGTFPLDYFQKTEAMYNPEKTIPLVSGALQTLQPKSESLHLEEAAQVALQETKMAVRLQRQLTAVASYAWYQDIGDSNCGICFGWPVNETGICMAECQHWFCHDCWVTYCMEQIHNGRVPIKCPEDCDTIVDYDTVTTILPLPVCGQYASRLRDQHLQRHSASWKWCPNVKCGRVVRIQQPINTDVITCTCGHIWCNACDGAVHWPVACEHAELYNKILKSHGDDATISENSERVVNVKRCPHCNLQMQKGFGCNHISCVCGKFFCWACLQNWDSGNHYNCKESKSKYENVQLRDVIKGISNLMSNNFYERAVAHRRATFPYNLRNVQKSLKNAPFNKNIMIYFSDSTKSEPLRNNHIAFRRHIINDTLTLYRQGHYILEHTYVWIYFCKIRHRTYHKALMSQAERLYYCMFELDQAILDGNLVAVAEALPHVRRLLKSLFNGVLSVKNSTDFKTVSNQLN